MNNYKIYIGAIANPTYVFTNEDIRSIDRVNSVDLVSEELSIDEFYTNTFYVQYLGNAFAPSDYDLIESSDDYIMCDKQIYVDMRTLPYGTPIYFFKNEVFINKYFVKNVERVAKGEYKINAMSAIGLLESQMHYGGKYTGQTFETVAQQIIGGVVSFSCEEDVRTTQIYGWLPYATKRENLHQLMFATSATLTKDANGDIRFSYVYSSSPEQVPDANIYIGGDIDYGSPANKVDVTEHAWVQLSDDKEYVLFDNSTSGETADHLLVVFDNAPIHDCKVDGTAITTVPCTIGQLTVHELGVNYAKVSGAGSLTGKAYTHLTQVVEKSVQTNAEDKTVSCDGCTLITVANSENVANRLMSYYSARKIIKCDIVQTSEQCGRQIQFTDPYGDTETGYIYKTEITSSGNEKAKCEIITDYTPQGQGNAYSNSVTLTGDGEWTIPASVFQKSNPSVKVVLIGGGNGGQSGGKGQNGNSVVWYTNLQYNEGGAGGVAGNGGNGGRVKTQVINCTGLTTLSYHSGAGGAGGVSSSTTPTDGGQGGHTTLTAGSTTYSSEAGTSTLNGYQNIFTGQVYGAKGKSDGVAGGHGDWNASNVVYNGVTYRCGSRGANGASSTDVGYGGGGGGGAVGSNGGNGSNGYGTDEKYREGGSSTYRYYAYGGSGGTGANASPRANATNIGQGGDGGHGGGGGGGQGYATSVFAFGGAGQGGLGGKGGNGMSGGIIIYY